MALKLKQESAMAPLMTISQLAKYLNFSVGGLYHMLPRITAADGKIKLGRVWRVDRTVVVARVKAGLFGRGLDENGKPVAAAPPGTEAARRVIETLRRAE